MHTLEQGTFKFHFVIGQVEEMFLTEILKA